MATLAHFKFPDIAIDTLPDNLTGDMVESDFKLLLIDLYDNHGGLASCGQGKFIFGNTAGDINAPVILVNVVALQYGVPDDDLKIVFWVSDVSDTFRIPV